MPQRRSAPPPDEVSRRLSLLGAELAAVREGGPAPRDGLPSEVGPESGSPVPVPGRHASPRAGAVVAHHLAQRLPDTLRGRVRLTGAQVVLVALAVLAGLLAAGWWAWRSAPGDPVPLAPEVATAPLRTPASSSDATPVATPTSSTASLTTPASVVVDVAGKVRRPGIVVLDSGSRVVDALRAAGGVRSGVDLSGINQARLLVDGEQILVGAPTVPGIAASAAPETTAGPGALVNINTATQAQLEELPGVGPVTAQAILGWRETNGAFTSVEELLEVDGIGDATLAELAPHVTI
ncbi:helix-hairpin-helix domain-containing protein [Nocardioides sp.]|uniref:ComEA family DNA-binding protein n=1 Tax=Nocardioides sp. TaxID=35761 RepID=UPI003D13279D